MSHQIVFLLGLHGSGKSTLGRHMVRANGWAHISMGDLGRLARSGKRPSDISLPLIAELAAHYPGQRLSNRLVETLMLEVSKQAMQKPVICDGFPAHKDHLSVIPKSAQIIYVRCAQHVREARLDHRANQTQRKWTPGLSSERDRDLPALLKLVTDSFSTQGSPERFLEIANDGNGLDSLKATAQLVIESSATAF